MRNSKYLHNPILIQKTSRMKTDLALTIEIKIIMKKLVLSAATMGFVLLSAQLSAQVIKSSKVPPAVKSALSVKYPSASKVSWENEKGNYEANWGGKSGEEMSVEFTPAGVFVEQAEAISLSRLPVGVKNYVSIHYKGSKIKEAGKIIDAKGTIMYEAEVLGKDLVFDESGKFIKID